MARLAWFLAAFALGAALTPALGAPLGGSSSVITPLPQVYHPPIRITSDAEFLLPTSGVVGGDGSANQPFIIENWLLLPMRVRGVGGAASSCASQSVGGSGGVPSVIVPGPVSPVLMHGLEIRDTTKHVVIRNVHVRGIDSTSSDPIDLALSQAHDSKFVSGIYLENARNVTIESGRFDGLYRGICARNVVELRIADVTVLNTFWHAMAIIQGQGVVVEHSVAQRSGPGPLLVPTGSGLRAESVNGLAASGNDFSANIGGVVLLRSNFALVRHNTISENQWGIISSFTIGTFIERNVIRQNVFGFSDGNTIGSPVATFRENNFIANKESALEALDSVFVDARENWWNCPDGPRPISSNSACDLITGEVQSVAVAPWLTGPVADAGSG